MLAATARGVRGFSGLHVLRLRVHLVPFVVLVGVPDPSHSMLQALFVAALWRNVQPVVGPDEYVQPATVARISVEDIAGGILVEDARSGPFLAWKLLHSIVVIDLAFSDLLLGH